MTSVDSPTQTHGSPPGPGRRRGERSPSAPGRVWLAALVVGAAVAVPAHLFAPLAPPPTAVLEGDADLLADVEALVDPGTVQGVSVARFPVDDPGAVEWVRGGTADGSVPVDGNTPFETASVFKTVTAMTFADMVEKGETSPDRTLGEIFPGLDFADPGTASATLEDLATHHSGLPTAPATDPLRHYVLPSLAFSDAYGWSPHPLEALAVTPANTRGEYEYSNLGFAVLGAALAAESGTPYGELVRERILDPLGMDDTVIVEGGVPEGGAAPHITPGGTVQPWHNTDYAPAGITTWSTTADLVRFLQAVSGGTAPGLAALDPVHEDVSLPGAPEDAEGGFGRFTQGLAWFTVDVPGHGPVTMHTGGSLGSATIAAFDDGHAVVVMANSRTLDSVGLGTELLKDDPQPLPGNPDWLAAFGLVTTLMMVVVPPVLLVSLMLRRRTLITQRLLDRLRIVSLSLGSLTWLVTGLRWGDWQTTPMVLWALAAGLVAAGLTVGAWHFRRVPAEAGRWRRLHVSVFALSVVFSLTLGSLMVWSMAIAA